MQMDVSINQSTGQFRSPEVIKQMEQKVKLVKDKSDSLHGSCDFSASLKL